MTPHYTVLSAAVLAAVFAFLLAYIAWQRREHQRLIRSAFVRGYAWGQSVVALAELDGVMEGSDAA